MNKHFVCRHEKNQYFKSKWWSFRTGSFRLTIQCIFTIKNFISLLWALLVVLTTTDNIFFFDLSNRLKSIEKLVPVKNLQFPFNWNKFRFCIDLWQVLNSIFHHAHDSSRAKHIQNQVNSFIKIFTHKTGIFNRLREKNSNEFVWHNENVKLNLIFKMWFIIVRKSGIGSDVWNMIIIFFWGMRWMMMMVEPTPPHSRKIEDQRIEMVRKHNKILTTTKMLKFMCEIWREIWKGFLVVLWEIEKQFGAFQFCCVSFL